ncbi:MAG: hypothetical protein ACOC7T_06130 [Planctomycetota bacterium]
MEAQDSTPHGPKQGSLEDELKVEREQGVAFCYALNRRRLEEEGFNFTEKSSSGGRATSERTGRTRGA